jgi:hypothetical protein
MTAPKHCSICGDSGHILHADLIDRLSGTPGSWDLLRCNNDACGLIWISPLPCPETLKQAYTNYYTHSEQTKPSLLRRIYKRCRIGYLVSRFSYPNTLANPIEKKWVVYWPYYPIAGPH